MPEGVTVTAPRVIVLSPRIDGDDGVSAVGRQILRALAGSATRRDIELWVLDGTSHTIEGVRPWLANGRRWRFGVRALEAMPSVGADVMVLSLHLQLGPVALPLVARGATLVQVVYGIEAWRAARGFIGCAVDRTAAFIVISHESRSRFLAAHPHVNAQRASVCHPAAPELAPPDEAPIGGPPFALVVGRMARDERYKGHDELIDAWPGVRQQIPSARLVVVGDGDDRDRLESRARAAGIAGAIEFTGRLSSSRLAAFYRDATCFLMPSGGEGFGLVFLEAMTFAKPCLGGPGAAEEVIEHGATGLIISPADRPALIAGIARLFGPDGRAMGEAGLARVNAQFRPHHFEARFLEAIDHGAVPRAAAVTRPVSHC